jgi:RNA polymerase sigma-70 factor (ECF subfamily)
VDTLTPSERRPALSDGTRRPPAVFTPPREEAALIAGLRRRDESSFLDLVQRYHLSLVRLAQTFVPSQAIAEEVAQETWLGVLQGIDRFQERSSLKTWIFQILVNRAKTRGQREARTISFSSIDLEPDTCGPSVDPSRFAGPDSEHPDHWFVAPQPWNLTPEQALLSQECQGHIEQAIAGLPLIQREVITMRDVQGWSSEEVCNILGVSETNCRVLLHRARSRVRRAMEEYLGADQGCRRQSKSTN